MMMYECLINFYTFPGFINISLSGKVYHYEAVLFRNPFTALCSQASSA